MVASHSMIRRGLYTAIVLTCVTLVVVWHGSGSYLFITPSTFFPPEIHDWVMVDRKYNAAYSDLGVVNDKVCRTGCFGDVIDGHKACIPDYFLIGVTKCATTSFYMYMRHHPEVYQYEKKEDFYWVTRNPYTTLVKLGEYLREFYPALDQEQYDNGVLGSHCPSTVWRNHWDKLTPGYQDGYDSVPLNELDATAVQLQMYTPCAKLIVVLRDPIQRTFSHYHFFAAEQGVTDESPLVDFDIWIVKEIDRLSECFADNGKLMLTEPLTPRYRSCVYDKARPRHLWAAQISVYVLFLDTWLQHFPLERFLFLDLFPKADEQEGDTITRMHELFGEVEHFLGLHPYLSDATKSSDLLQQEFNKGTKHDISVASTKLMREFFRPFNEALFARINKRFEW